jgi:hypothetical protein
MKPYRKTKGKKRNKSKKIKGGLINMAMTTLNLRELGRKKTIRGRKVGDPYFKGQMPQGQMPQGMNMTPFLQAMGKTLPTTIPNPVPTNPIPTNPVPNTVSQPKNMVNSTSKTILSKGMNILPKLINSKNGKNNPVPTNPVPTTVNNPVPTNPVPPTVNNPVLNKPVNKPVTNNPVTNKPVNNSVTNNKKSNKS